MSCFKRSTTRRIAPRRSSVVAAASPQTWLAAAAYCRKSDRTSESSAWPALKSSAKDATRRDSPGSKPNLSSLLRSAALVDSRSLNKTFAGADPPSSMIVVLVPREALYRFGRGIGAVASAPTVSLLSKSTRFAVLFGAVASIALFDAWNSFLPRPLHVPTLTSRVGRHVIFRNHDDMHTSRSDVRRQRSGQLSASGG